MGPLLSTANREMTKLCPTCDANCPAETVSCDCGYLFIDEIESRRDIERADLESRLRRKRIRLLVVSATITSLLCGVITYWAGIFQSPSEKADVKLLASPLKSSEQPEPINAASVQSGPLDNSYNVASVISGSEIVLVDSENRRYDIRLVGIVAPKLDETFGKESRDNLSKMISGKNVSFIKKSDDKNGLVGEIVCGNSNVGLEQLRLGLAAVNKDEIGRLSVPERQPYLYAEVLAQTSRSGVWGSGKAITFDRYGENTEIAKQSIVTTAEVTQRQEQMPPQTKDNGDERSQQVGTVRELTNSSIPPAVTKKIENVPANADVSVKPESVVDGAVQPTAEQIETKVDPQEKKYTLGPRGGCYYINSKGTKSYVDHRLCN